MSRNKLIYICGNCGYQTTKWLGRCPSCSQWNTFSEQREAELKKEKVAIRINPAPITKIEAGARPRFSSGFGELDRVLGGGIVNGSLVLLGGAPGIGKSTLILQVASLFSKGEQQVLYISGEESAAQIKMRASRLAALSDNLLVLPETEFDQIAAIIASANYGLVVIDSIQTIYDPAIDSAPGSINQVREITKHLIKIAKKREIPIFLIGHVTKEGELAGPRVLEHLVDTVLQFEGDRNYAYRILRALKNRFGPTNEVGVFEMKNDGMEEVLNPSQLFLEERPAGVAGSIIVPVMEGSRPLLIEVQSLVSPGAFSVPQRLTTGVDHKRVNMLLAVLEKKAGIAFAHLDVHINITGGFKVEEPALDLGLVAAIVSSHHELALPAGLAVIGEIGLAGEVRAISQIQSRLKELKKIGFTEVILPGGNLKGLDLDPALQLNGIKNIHQLIDYISEVGD